MCYIFKVLRIKNKPIVFTLEMDLNRLKVLRTSDLCAS